MPSLAGALVLSLVPLSLFACEGSTPLVDDVREDAAERDTGADARDGAAD